MYFYISLNSEYSFQYPSSWKWIIMLSLEQFLFYGEIFGNSSYKLLMIKVGYMPFVFPYLSLEIGRRHNKRSILFQNSSDFLQKVFILLDMLYGFKRHYDIKSIIIEWEFLAVS